jgi:hypothetical protein
MSRPLNKNELLHLSQKNYAELIDFVDSLTEAERNKSFPQGTMNRNIRDVLAHLHHWHKMLLDWYAVGMSGQIPDMPAKGYTWKMTPELNKWIWGQYQNTDLKEVEGMLDESFQDIQHIITSHTNEELYEKRKYKWTGSTSLGAYLVSASSSHYDWALKLIKKAFK